MARITRSENVWEEDKVGVLIISAESRIISNIGDGTCIITVLGIGDVSSND